MPPSSSPQKRLLFARLPHYRPGVSFALGDKLTLTISDIAFGGEGVARKDDFVVFVPFVAVGEVVEAELTEVKKRFARGRLLRSSSLRRNGWRRRAVILANAAAASINTWITRPASAQAQTGVRPFRAARGTGPGAGRPGHPLSPALRLSQPHHDSQPMGQIRAEPEHWLHSRR